MRYTNPRTHSLTACGGGTRVVCATLSRSSVETTERIELVVGTGASFDLSYTVLRGNSGIFINKDT